MEKVIAENIKSFSGLIAEMKTIVSRKAESTYCWSDLVTDIQLMSEYLEYLEYPEVPHSTFYWIVSETGTIIRYNERSAKRFAEFASQERTPESFRIECKNHEFSITELIF